jgi:regulator of sigma E protease
LDAPWSFGPTSIAAFIIFIGVLIFVHELGHFLVAKLFDIKVTKFSLGFGPPIVAFERGETTYQVAAVPLGGFVKMVGEHPDEELTAEERARSFSSAPIYQRALVSMAGPAFNLAFPILCFFAYNLMGPQVEAPVVGQVAPGRPAAEAGLRPGDRIVAVDGTRTYSFERVRELVSARPGEPIELTVRRDGETRTIPITPDASVSESLFGTRRETGIIGVALTRQGTRVGIDDPARAPPGIRSGDRFLRVGDTRVRDVADLVRALRSAAGHRVEVAVERPEPRRAGDLLHADLGRPLTVHVDVPADFDRLEDLGLAPASQILRDVVPGGAAARAGLRAGDRIVAVDGRPVGAVWSFLVRLSEADGAPVEVTYRRDGETRHATLEPDAVDCVHPVTRKSKTSWDSGLGSGALPSPPSCEALEMRQHLLGAWSSSVPPETERVRLSVGEAFTASVRKTGEVIGLVLSGIIKLFTNQVSVENVGGPIALFKLAAQAVETGWLQYLWIMALVSVNLGLVNLLPIPLFDGGHLLFCLIEAVKRRPVSVRTREYANLFGLVVIMALLLLALRNDILSLGVF